MSRRFARAERVVLATHNRGKITELTALLMPAGLLLCDSATLGLAAPDEGDTDFEDNARLKAKSAARRSGLPALADDSGFAVAALGGAPGVHSGRWAEAAGGFEAAMRQVCDQAGRHADRRAWFVCVLAVAWPDGEVAHWTGCSHGSWTWPPRGRNGFGYDPIFVPDGQMRTFAEMTSDEKEAHSHRGRAFAAFAEACLP